MIEKYQKFVNIFAATSIIGFLLIKGFYVPCLIVVWLFYSYNSEREKDSFID